MFYGSGWGVDLIVLHGHFDYDIDVSQVVLSFLRFSNDRYMKLILQYCQLKVKKPTCTYYKFKSFFNRRNL